MRVMLKFTFPTREPNPPVHDGSIGQTMQTMIGNLQPEAVHFCHVDGKRGGYLVVNMEEGSELVTKKDSFFLQMGAEVETFPVMNADELGAGLQNLGPNGLEGRGTLGRRVHSRLTGAYLLCHSTMPITFCASGANAWGE